MANSEQNQDSPDFVHRLAPSLEENLALYKEYAVKFDEVMEGFGYEIQPKLVKLLSHYVPEMFLENRNCSILDVGAGTGTVAKCLRDQGYKGVIDGIEGSDAMTMENKVKDTYRNITMHIITEDNLLPYQDCTYDALLCCGVFSAGHIPHQCLKDLLRVTKVGGMLLFNLSHQPHESFGGMDDSLSQVMNDLIAEGKCTLVEKVTVTGVYNKGNGVEDTANLFCYRKTESKQ